MGKVDICIISSDSDIRTVERLAREIWSEHYEPIIGIEQVEYMLQKYQSFESIKSAIKEGYVYCIVKYDNCPCGYMGICKNNGIFLSKFYLNKNFRGLSIGRKMSNWINNYAINNESGRIWLTCNKNNSKTINIYKKLGFLVIDSVVTDIGNGFVMDDYVMERKI